MKSVQLAMMLLALSLVASCAGHEDSVEQKDFEEFYSVDVSLPMSKASFLQICDSLGLRSTDIGQESHIKIPLLRREDGTIVSDAYSSGLIVVEAQLRSDGSQPRYIALISDNGMVEYIIPRFAYPPP